MSIDSTPSKKRKRDEEEPNKSENKKSRTLRDLNIGTIASPSNLKPPPSPPVTLPPVASLAATATPATEASMYAVPEAPVETPKKKKHKKKKKHAEANAQSTDNKRIQDEQSQQPVEHKTDKSNHDGTRKSKHKHRKEKRAAEKSADSLSSDHSTQLLSSQSQDSAPMDLDVHPTLQPPTPAKTAPIPAKSSKTQTLKAMEEEEEEEREPMASVEPKKLSATVDKFFAEKAGEDISKLHMSDIAQYVKAKHKLSRMTTKLFEDLKSIVMQKIATLKPADESGEEEEAEEATQTPPTHKQPSKAIALMRAPSSAATTLPSPSKAVAVGESGEEEEDEDEEEDTNHVSSTPTTPSTTPAETRTSKKKLARQQPHMVALRKIRMEARRLPTEFRTEMIDAFTRFQSGLADLYDQIDVVVSLITPAAKKTKPKPEAPAGSDVELEARPTTTKKKGKVAGPYDNDPVVVVYHGLDIKTILEHYSRTPTKDGSDLFVLDLSTSSCSMPWLKLDPVFPHGNLPVPFMEGVVSASVEGIWEGLKVFDKQDIDTSKFMISNMRNLRRGRPGTERGWRAGNTILTGPEARVKIFLPVYRSVLDRYCQAEIAALREQLAAGKRIVLRSGIAGAHSIDDLFEEKKPVNWPLLVKLYVEGKWPMFDAGTPLPPKVLQAKITAPSPTATAAAGSEPFPKRALALIKPAVPPSTPVPTPPATPVTTPSVTSGKKKSVTTPGSSSKVRPTKP